MKDYKNDSPVFSDSISITETTDAAHADNINAAPKQLLANTLHLKKEMEYMGNEISSHINELVTNEKGVHGLRAINKSLQVFNEGKWEKLTATDDVLLELERLKSKIDRLNDAIFNDITKNPFLIRFDDLDGITVKKGNFNKEKQRIEC